jgi:hypothetical protein
MSKLDEREQGFEAQFRHEQELAFKIASRRNMLLGLWAAEHLGLNGAAAEAYAQDLVVAEFAKPGHAEMVARLARDFAERGIAIDTMRITDEYHRLSKTARKQVMSR